MKRATKDILYFETGPDNEPTLHVEPGEEFEVETQINSGPWIDGRPDEDELRRRLSRRQPVEWLHICERRRAGPRSDRPRG